ncbi:hypothetical protein PR202_ga20344 [Eleusine coracana subsp. coracana]|uniref:Uncharacterized protein n=1 Tax=Eleusine coracana subsp. coracana TaxID=191504 RepID=A0AAV5CYH8_ELECO|nr:hypothetical protein PR202_ga20344 [Eleusine coracana subsp. coracana]
MLVVKKFGPGIAGIQGMFYSGTGCFHRRKVIYGVQPAIRDLEPGNIKGSPSYKELQAKLGSSRELVDSSRIIISGNLFSAPIVNIPCRVEAAKEVSACNYEYHTCWGQEVGWVYGSLTEDILTGQRIHSAGWRSAYFDTDPPAFLGSAPTGGPASLTQYKRWTTGLFEIFLSKNNPVVSSILEHLEFRQCLGYLVVYVWPASEPSFIVPLALFLMCNIYDIMEYMDCRMSARAWWNNHRMQRISSASAWILAFLTVLLKTLGLSETVFEVTRKDQSKPDASEAGAEAAADPGRFTFDSSPVFILPTALAILNIVAIAVAAWRVVCFAGAAEFGPGAGEFVCCGWMVLCFWPFVRGFVGKGSYGIPWSVILKAGMLVSAFVHFCRRI